MIPGRIFSQRAQAIVTPILAAVCIGAVHAQTPAPQSLQVHYRHSRLITAWLPYWENQDGAGDGWKSVENNLGLLDEVSFFNAEADPATGALAEKFGCTPANLDHEIAELHVNQIQAFATVTEFNHIHDLLANAPVLQKLSDNIVALVAEHDFDGVDIDFEDLRDDNVGDAALFTQFMDSLAARLHQRKDDFQLPCTVAATILARTSRGHFNFADETALANSDIDQVRIMAYDENYPGSKTAGANAPLPWYASVGAYLRGVNAPTWKFVIGIPAYGDRWPVLSASDWTTTGRGKTVVFSDAQKMIAEQKLTREWSASDGAPYLSYIDPLTRKPTIAFYEDAQSWKAKLQTVIAAGGPDDVSQPGSPALGGLAEWALGYEDPAAWTAVGAALQPDQPVFSAIGNCYAHYGAGGRFGIALTAEQDAGPFDGNAWNRRAGRLQQFEDGTLYYEWGRPRAFYVTAPLLAAYRKEGGPDGPYGFPVADPVTDAGGNVSQQFEHGTLAALINQVSQMPNPRIEAGFTLAEAAVLAVGAYAARRSVRTRTYTR